MEAILHGADAVYIGGPSFGARANAGNSVADIGRLADFAHRFNARVLVAINTILKDEELETARRLIWQCYEAGADALIVQDMGLLELDLPPIQLHASTQCDIRTPRKAQFLESVGFSQMVLARELTLDQIRSIAEQTSATLEFFVHGALCVSYSGQCYMSHATTGRSANRGDCSQACRLPYSLSDGEGRVLAAEKHLLSLKDNDQTDNLRALIDAGIRSFKIEGRLKDLSYVKNVTAHYRQQLDALLAADDSLARTSAGRSHFFFEPQPEKTFNRGRTDYFVRQRHADVGAFDTPKFSGERIGTVLRLGPTEFDVDSRVPINNGDGLAYFNPEGELTGLRVNTAAPITGGYRLSPSLVDGSLPAGIAVGAAIFRNHDQEFIRQLGRKSAERRIGVRLTFTETADGFALHIEDENGVGTSVNEPLQKQPAQNAERAVAALRDGLGKLGNTIYAANAVEIEMSTPWFLPASTINALRRRAIDALDDARRTAYQRPERASAQEPPMPYPDDALSYLGNVYNEKARTFYEKHGVKIIEPAFECGQEKGEVSLMVTKHCVRFSLSLCPKQVKGIRPDPLVLINGNEKLTLRFDCKPCEMHVVGRLRKDRTLALRSEPASGDEPSKSR